MIIPIKKLNSSIWFLYETLKGTTTPDQSGPCSIVNEEVIPVPQA